jgi:proteasome lid subunit RPN8/RPN11
MRSIIDHFVKRPVFVADSWTLQDLYQELVKGPCEEICYVTGVQLDNVRVLSRMCPLEYESQSSVFVRATRKSSADALIEMIEHGNTIHLVGHSHPGCGAYATLPSWTDINYMRKLQRSGAEAIAMIVSRNGFLRFWTVSLPFKLIIRGSGISEVKGHNNVYHLETQKTDSEQSDKAERQALLSI